MKSIKTTQTLLLTGIISIFSTNAFATYCSLKTPQYCPKQNDPSVTNNVRNTNTNWNKNSNWNNNVNKNVNMNKNFNQNKLSQNQAQKQFQSQAATANSNSTSGATVQGFNGNGGTGSASVSTGDVNTSFNSSQPRQTPFAYSPTISLGYNQFKCRDSVSLGASAPFGAIGGGVPIGDDFCEALVAAAELDARGFPVEACMVRMSIPIIADAFKRSGKSCIPVVVPVPTAPQTSNWLNEFNSKYPPLDNSKLDTFHKEQMMK